MSDIKKDLGLTMALTEVEVLNIRIERLEEVIEEFLDEIASLKRLNTELRLGIK